MATLKSIKNKYLTTTDGTTLGVSANADNVALLAFKMQASDSIAKFNMVDGFSDAYVDATGVDASASTNESLTSGYYKGEAVVTPTVSGNWNSTGTDGDYTWYRWTTVTSSGSYTTNTAQDYEYLVIAGGGGGGSGHGSTGVGGGGAGGYRTATGFAVAATTIGSITVGTGASGQSSSNNGGKGSNSSFSTITSTGGSGGRLGNSNGVPGGSGGGGGSGYPGGTQTGGPGNEGGFSPVEGYRGGTAAANASGGGGGGGGAGANGPDFDQSNGTGGAGRSSSIDGSATIRGGGGGASGGSGPDGAGGSGGGGGGTRGGGDGVDGTANTGGGGGGCRASGTSGDGGSGIVIIRRPTTTSGPGNLTLISNSATASAQADTADIVATYTNGAGTATLNTDLKYYVSRDNGTTYTEAVMVSQGTSGGHTLISHRGIDISGQPAGTTMRYKVTTHNQTASKETRAQAVSLAWA